MHGSPGNPIVVTNKNGAVKIYDPGNWGAIQFKDCSYIHFTGTGSAENYGFTLTAREAGVALTELSTDIEVDHVKITIGWILWYRCKEGLWWQSSNAGRLFLQT